MRSWLVEATVAGEQALAQRSDKLIARGLAQRREDGGTLYQPDLLATLQRRELDRAG